MKATDKAKVPALGLAVVAAALFSLGALRILVTFPNHDLAWLLYMAGEILDGARPYVDIIETNPPLVVYLMIAVEWLSRALSLGDFFVLKVLVLGLVAVSVTVGLVLLRRVLPGNRGWLAPVLTLVSIFLLVPFAGIEFAQREHLMLVLLLPFLYVSALRASGQSVPPSIGWIVGVAAGLGVALKPFFVLVWLGIEAYLFLVLRRKAWRRPEVVAIPAVLVAYVLSVLALTPAFLDVAAKGAGVYRTYHRSNPITIALSWPMAFSIVVLVTAWFLRRSVGRSPLRDLLSVAMGGFMIAVFVQNKGWDYHWYPVIVLGTLLLCLIAAELFLPLTRHPRRQLVGAVGVGILAIFLLVATAIELRAARTEWDSAARNKPYYLEAMAEIVEEHAFGGTISSLTTELQASFPLVNLTSADWGSRFNCLWMLPGIYADVISLQGPFPYHPPDQRGEVERWMIESVIEDLAVKEPNLLIVDMNRPDRYMAGFDYLAYFSEDPRFRDLLAQYRFLTDVGRYRIFKRTL